MEIHGKHNERQVSRPPVGAPGPAGGAAVPDPGASRGRGCHAHLCVRRPRPGRGCRSPGNARARGKLSEPSLGGGAVTTAQVALTDAPSASLVFARSPRSSPWRPAPLLASWQVAQLSSGPVAGQSAAGTRWGGGVREPRRGGRRRQGLRQGREEPAGGHGCVTPPRAASRRGLRVRCQQRLRFLWRVRDRGVPRGEEGRLGLCPAVRGRRR